MSRTQSSVEANLVFNNLYGFSVAYTNHKGIELPLKNMKDFSEAIKSAKCKGQNHLNLIFYDHNLKSHEATALNNGKYAINGKFSKNQNIEIPCTDTVSSNSSKAEKVCENSLPEWFKQYMKKFKKEILKDLRLNIAQIVHEEFEKQKKMTEEKLIESLPDKNESSSPTKLKKKRRTSYKNSLDLLEKREVKLLKKIEMLRSSKFDRMMSPVLQLEKLENKARALVDEKIKLLERGCQSKSKNLKKTKEPEKQHTKSKKTAIFRESDVFFFLQPGAEFSVTVDILNNGTVPWVSPRMECLDAPAIYLKEHLINLPRLEPGHSVSATLRGKVGHRLGNYYFLYQLLDGLEEFAGPLFTCFAVVSDSKEEVISNSKQLKPDNKTTPTGNLVGSLIDFEKDVIASSQKKIKENIIEIERRLQDIDLLRPCTTGDENREARSNSNAGEFEITGCDLLQGEEIKCWKERLQKGMISGVDSLQQKEETKKSKQMDENFKSGSSQTKINGTESDSDSELSIIFMSEEEENFFFLPLFPESSNSETVNDTAKLSKLDLNSKSNKASQKLKEDIVEESDIKVELKESKKEEISSLKNCLPRRRTIEEEEFLKKLKPSLESAFAFNDAESPGVIFNQNLGENVPENASFRTLKETDFSPHNTTFNVPNVSPVDKSLTGETSSSTNKKSGVEINNGQGASHYIVHNTQEFTTFQNIKTSNTARKGYRVKTVPTSKCFGNSIFVVRNDGYCLPVKNFVKDKIGVPDDVDIADLKEEPQNEMKEETNLNYKAAEDLIATSFPNVLMIGASSVASMAFNTAKLVIKNF